MDEERKLNKLGKHNDGRSKLPEYKIWKNMRNRCYNQHNHKYSRYGGRGICVCKRWDDFWAFYHDMGKRPHGMTIDRVDVDGNYEPDNCRWADTKTQNNNRTTTIKVRIGDTIKSVKEWADIYGISDLTVRDRFYRGWDIVKALTTPAGRYYGKGKAKR